MASSFFGFKLNHPGVGELLKGSAGKAAVESRIGAVEGAAKSGAPVASGAYRDSIHVEWVTTDRVVGRVVADVDYAMVVEADTGNLARALDAAGGS